MRVVDLAAAHAVSRPAISRHLRVLGEAGLVQSTDHGRERHYALTPAPLAEVHAFTGALLAGNVGDPGEVGDRPAPLITASHLDALDTEVRRTTRDRRSTAPASRRGKASA